MEKTLDFNAGAVIYISEHGDEYTKEDFIEAAKGNIEYAEILFNRVEWQSPFTLVDEDLTEDEVLPYGDTYLMNDPKKYWDLLGGIPVDEELFIEEQFLDFVVGTHVFDIWHWFEDFFDISIGNDLMFKN